MARQELDDVIEKLGMGPYQIYTIILLSGLVIQDGAEMLLVSALVRSMAGEFQSDPIMRGLAVSSVFVGMSLGGLLSGWMGDRFGRKPACLVAYVFVVIFGLSCSVAWSMKVVIFLRFWMGVGVGIGVPATTTLMIEILPTNVRALIYNSSWSGMFVIGQMWAATGLMILMPDLKGPEWRKLCIWSAVPGLILLPFCMLYLKESPRWLMINRKREELEHLLRYAAQRNGQANLDIMLDESCFDADPDPEEQSQSLMAAHAGGLASSSSAREASPARRSEGEAASWMTRMGMLFRQDTVRTTLIGSYLLCICNFMFYGQSYAFTEKFETSTSDWVMPATELMMTSAFTLPGMALATFFIMSTIGHRQSIAFCAILPAFMSVAMISGDYNRPLIYDGACYMYVLFTTALFNLMYVYVPEAYPSVIRQTGCSVCMSIGRLGCIVAPVIFEVLKIKFNKSHVPFLLLNASLALLGSYSATYLTLETKGMRLAEYSADEIHQEQKEADGKHKSNDQVESTPLLLSKS